MNVILNGFYSGNDKYDGRPKGPGLLWKIWNIDEVTNVQRTTEDPILGRHGLILKSHHTFVLELLLWSISSTAGTVRNGPIFKAMKIVLDSLDVTNAKEEGKLLADLVT